MCIEDKYASLEEEYEELVQENKRLEVAVKRLLGWMEYVVPSVVGDRCYEELGIDIKYAEKVLKGGR